MNTYFENILPYLKNNRSILRFDYDTFIEKKSKDFQSNYCYEILSELEDSLSFKIDLGDSCHTVFAKSYYSSFGKVLYCIEYILKKEEKVFIEEEYTSFDSVVSNIPRVIRNLGTFSITNREIQTHNIIKFEDNVTKLLEYFGLIPDYLYDTTHILPFGDFKLPITITYGGLILHFNEIYSGFSTVSIPSKDLLTTYDTDRWKNRIECISSLYNTVGNIPLYKFHYINEKKGFKDIINTVNVMKLLNGEVFEIDVVTDFEVVLPLGFSYRLSIEYCVHYEEWYIQLNTNTGRATHVVSNEKELIEFYKTIIK